MSDFQIIRTVEELEALGEDALLAKFWKNIHSVYDQWLWLEDCRDGDKDVFPLVLLMDGAQVRAAREAMEEDGG